MIILLIPLINGIMFINSDLSLQGSAEHGFFCCHFTLSAKIGLYL